MVSCQNNVYTQTKNIQTMALLSTLVHLINVQHNLFFFENFQQAWQFQILHLLIFEFELTTISLKYAYFGHFWPNIYLKTI